MVQGQLAELGVADQTIEVDCRPNSPVGEFVVDLAALETGEDIAATLAARPEFARVVHREPRVYLTADVDFLRGCVAAAVLEGLTFVHKDIGGGETATVTFSDPNANKPLHVGHVRNHVIGMALARLYESRGYDVKRSEIMCDVGIHICQAVVAYQVFGGGATPESVGQRGDQFVGDYYVRFHTENEAERKALGLDADEAPGKTRLEQLASEMLRGLEAGDEDLWALNRQVTDWAESGMYQTYARLGTDLHLVHRERDTLQIGLDAVNRGLAEGICQQRADGSVFIDLTDEGLGEFTLLRHDGTQTVRTRLIGWLVAREHDFPDGPILDVLGDDWNPGFGALLSIMRRLGFDWIDRVSYLHHGLVKMADGKMRSRRGHVVEADALLDRIRDYFFSRPTSVPSTDAVDEHWVNSDLLAVALVKYFFLRVPRGKDVVFVEDDLFTRSLPTFLTLLTLFNESKRLSEEPASNPSFPSGRGEAELRRLLLHLNVLPDIVDEAFVYLEPAKLVRYLDELPRLVKKAQQRDAIDPLTWRSIHVVMQHCFHLLNIELPVPVSTGPATAGSISHSSVGAASAHA